MRRSWARRGVVDANERQDRAVIPVFDRPRQQLEGIGVAARRDFDLDVGNIDDRGGQLRQPDEGACLFPPLDQAVGDQGADCLVDRHAGATVPAHQVVFHGNAFARTERAGADALFDIVANDLVKGRGHALSLLRTLA